MTTKISDLDLVTDEELALARASLPEHHSSQRSNLYKKYVATFPQWHFQLRCGFNLLFSGIGSKVKLLELFADSELKSHGTVVSVCGYIQKINMKEVLRTIHGCIERQQSRSGRKSRKSDSLGSIEDLLDSISRPSRGAHVYVLIHKIDGPGLSDGPCQQILARLAAMECIHLVASFDNVNTPLLWDAQTSNNRFNWWWHYTPTFEAYSRELSTVSALLVPKKKESAQNNAIAVLRQLQSNARGVFRVLAEHQQNDDEGMPFHQWYTRCREKFLVSNEVTLKAYQTEFHSHGLLKSRRGESGLDHMCLSLSKAEISEVLTQIDNTN